MAPTVCMPDFPEMEKSHSYSRRRQKNQDGSISKRQRVELKEIPNQSPKNSEKSLPHSLIATLRPRCPADFDVSAILRSPLRIPTRIPSTQNNNWKMVLRRDGLLDIFVRTIDLARRNHILQERVNALHEETQNFISSVMSNPENQIQEVDKENEIVSSTTGNNSKSPSPPVLQSRTDSELNKVSSSSEIDNQKETEC